MPELRKCIVERHHERQAPLNASLWRQWSGGLHRISPELLEHGLLIITIKHKGDAPDRKQANGLVNHTPESMATSSPLWPVPALWPGS